MRGCGQNRCCGLALEFQQRVPFRQAHLEVVARILGSASAVLSELADDGGWADAQVQPLVRVVPCGYVSVQVVGHKPVSKHVEEGGLVAQGFEVGGDALDSVLGLCHETYEVVVPPVVLGKVLHEQRGRAVVGERGRIVGGPGGELSSRVSREESDEGEAVVRQVLGDLGESLVDPGLLAGVGSPVDGVLELVGKSAQVWGPSHERPSAHVDHLSLVAVGVDRLGVLVGGAEVPGHAAEGCVKNGEPWVVVDAGRQLGPECLRDGGINGLVEGACGGLQVLLPRLVSLVEVPVCVVAHVEQIGVHLVHAQVRKVRHPEGVRAPSLVGDRFRVHRGGHRQLHVRAKPANEREDVPVRGVRELRGLIRRDRFGRWRTGDVHGWRDRRRGGWIRWRGSGSWMRRRGGWRRHRSVGEQRRCSRPGGRRGRARCGR